MKRLPIVWSIPSLLSRRHRGLRTASDELAEANGASEIHKRWRTWLNHERAPESNLGFGGRREALGFDERGNRIRGSWPRAATLGFISSSPLACCGSKP